MKLFITFFLILSIVYEGICLSDGKSSNTCYETILEQYNVNPAICSSNFAVIPSTSTYTIDEPVRMTISGNTADKTFIGVHLLAEDRNNKNVGSWETTDRFLENALCGSLMHNSKVEKTSVNAIWHASSDVVGDITIRTIVIEDDETIYVGCYNILLTPRVLNDSSVTIPNALALNTTTISTSTTDTTTTQSTATTSTTTVQSTTTENTTTTQSTATTSTTIAQSTTTTISTTQSTTTVTVTNSSSASNTTEGPSPTADVSVNVTWAYNSDTKVTNVFMIVNNLKSSQYAALGLNLEQAMGGAHVFMCKLLTDNTVVVNRYINPDDHDPPQSAGSEDGGTFTPGQQQFKDGVVTCQFNLTKFDTEELKPVKDVSPLSQSVKYHSIFAVGPLDSNNKPHKHAKDSRTAQSDLVQLNQNENILYKLTPPAPDDDGSDKYLRAHGVIMIVTWMLIVSTGILVSRYFKNSWSDILICGKAAWFAAHRFLMSIAVVLIVLGLLFILVVLEGTWVKKGPTRPYAHSITGVLAISLAFFQPFIALFRCEPNSQHRIIFNLLHGFVGVSAFILSIAALFLATYFELFVGNKARILMGLWIVWVALIFTAFEFLSYYYRRTYSLSNYSNINTSNKTIDESVETPLSAGTLGQLENQVEHTSHQRTKTILLVIHIVVAATFSIIFSTFIKL